MNESSEFTKQGQTLTPGVNVDAVDVAAGLRELSACGYDDPNMRMLAQYCLDRWAKGEEALAEKTAVGMGIDLTSWRRILAAGIAAAQAGSGVGAGMKNAGEPQ